MKTDEDSGEADEPPEEPPSSECIAKKTERKENKDLQCVRNHRAQDPAHLPESRPASANSEPAAQAAFRNVFIILAGFILAQVVDPLTAQEILRIINGTGG